MEIVVPCRRSRTQTRKSKTYVPTIFAGWARNPDPDIWSDNSIKVLDHSNSLFMACHPRFLTRLATLRADFAGYIEDQHLSDLAQHDPEGNSATVLY
jgi:hypothetical protein